MATRMKNVVRLDVFSLKGGVGKTSLALELARAWRKRQPDGRRVLVVDADLTGSCLGDLLQPLATDGWAGLVELDALLCSAPELLDSTVQASLPVFLEPPQRRDAQVKALRGTLAPGAGLLFAPSHPYTTPLDARCAVDLPVLHGLLGNESAGRWVERVFDAVITETHRRAQLALVVVDHAPGMGALQRATLEQVQSTRDGTRRALVVGSRDAVDLRMVRQFYNASGAGTRGLSNVTFAVNRVPTGDGRQSWE